MSVEEQRVLGEWLRVELVINVEVLDVGLVVLVLDLDPGALVEGHGQVAVEGCGTPILLLLRRFHRDGEREGLEVRRHRVAEAEEVSNRRQHVRTLGLIPVHLDEDFTVVVGVIDFKVQSECVMDLHHGHSGLGVRDQARSKDLAAGLHKPQVRNCTRALEIGEHSGFAGQDDKCIFVESALVPAGNASAASGLSFGDVGEEVASQGRTHVGGT